MADVLARRLGASWEEEELDILAFDDDEEFEEEDWEEDEWEDDEWEDEDEWDDEDEWEDEEDWEEEWEDEDDEPELGRRSRREEW
jgi:hypothetical protein